MKKIVISLIPTIILSATNVKLDLNGDGKGDFVWKKSIYYSTWYMNANGTHRYKYLGKVPSTYQLVAINDLNGDGRADFVWKKGIYYSVWYINANGTHRYKYLGKVPSTYQLVATNDFNGDGRADFVWKKGIYYSTWFMNSNGTHKYKYLGKVPSTYQLVATNDFNGDGRADFVWKKGIYYSTWFMNSNGTHKYKYLGKIPSTYQLVATNDFNGDGRADFVWKKGIYYSTWFMNSNGTHKYKYLGKVPSTYQLVTTNDLNGDGRADFVWKKDKYYSTWYMNSNGTHRYKYLGKVSTSYKVIENNNPNEALPIVSTSKLFFNGNPNTTTISKSMSIGSNIEGVNLTFKPSINMTGDTSFSLNFKNGGFDVSNFYPALCVGTKEVGNMISFGDNYDSDNSIVYNPVFQISYDVSNVSKNSLITFHKDNCNSDVQPITTASTKDIVIETQVVNALSPQGVSIGEFNTNGVKIKVSMKAETVNKKPIANAGENTTVTVNESVTLYGSGTDSDGTIVSYEWKKGSEVLGTNATLTYTPTAIGTDTLTLTVTDDDGATASDSVQITVEDSSDNPFEDIKK